MKILKFAAFMVSCIAFSRLVWDLLSFNKIVPKRNDDEIKANFILFAVSTLICVLLHRKPNKNNIKETCNK